MTGGTAVAEVERRPKRLGTHKIEKILHNSSRHLLRATEKIAHCTMSWCILHMVFCATHVLQGRICSVPSARSPFVVRPRSAFLAGAISCVNHGTHDERQEEQGRNRRGTNLERNPRGSVTEKAYLMVCAHIQLASPRWLARTRSAFALLLCHDAPLSRLDCLGYRPSPRLRWIPCRTTNCDSLQRRNRSRR